MLYLILIYLLFSVLVTLRQRKSPGLLWFLMMPLGFSMALFGLMLFTEYISYANFTDNPLFISGNLFVWKLNYFLDLSIIGMYRLMNIGIALYILGAITYPLSQHPRRSFLKRGLLVVAVPSLLILVADPGFLQHLFRPDTVFQGMQSIFIGLNVTNRVLNIMVKAALICSTILYFWIHYQTPQIFRMRSKLMILGILPIHALVFVLFYWFPSHSIHVWRLSTLKHISLPYTGTMTPLILTLSFISMASLVYVSVVYNSFEMHARRRQLGFRARMKTAGTGLKIFTHSIKNQFIAAKLLAEYGMAKEDGREQMEAIRSLCEKTIARIGALSVLPDRIAFDYRLQSSEELLSGLRHEFPEVRFFNEVPKAEIMVDEYYFCEVMRNLLVNSREAVKDREHPKIEVYSRRQLSYLIFSVEDNGCGIDAETLRHIFEPFYSTKPSISNWGMGLAYTQQLVEAFGGAIEAKSQAGFYTKIYIYLPEEIHG